MTSKTVRKLYVVMIKVVNTMPWVELEGTYNTKEEAQTAANHALKSLQTRVVNMPRKKHPVKTLVSVKSRH